MEYFVNRTQELEAFKQAVNALFDNAQSPPVLLFHGTSGMGKSWLLRKCEAFAQEDRRQPFTIFVDCNRTNMTLEVLFNDIHTALENEFREFFDKYLNFLEELDDIEARVEEEAAAAPENAQKLASVISAVATKAVASTVPGASVVGEENIGKALHAIASGVTGGITALRSKFAHRRLDRKKYRLFLKDLQAEQAKTLAQILNTIADKKKRKLILFVDRFEKLAMMPNERSDLTFYQYWRDHFVGMLSANILLVQGARMDCRDDYQLHLQDRGVQSFKLKRFAEQDIVRILSGVLRQQTPECQAFANLVIQKTLGYPVAVGLLKGNLQSLASLADITKIRNDILLKETNIIEQSIRWLLDNSTDPAYRETVYKLAVCCSASGRIDKSAVAYVSGKAHMSLPEVEAVVQRLSQHYSFIDAAQWTMHELAREVILRYVKLRDPEYHEQINREIMNFYIYQAEEVLEHE